jgi:thioredoxin reductase
VTSVVIVGGGPAGLACAVELRRHGIDDVIVLEREATAGGIPRHAVHQGFGLRDLHRVMSGPRYARRYVELARSAGAEIREQTMVTHLAADGTIETTSPRGREVIEPRALVLATGCRERPRSARLVAGSRPDGVMTTGLLQQRVYIHGERIGGRALIVGAEHVSFSAVLTLAHAGASVVAMVTELPRHQSLLVARVGVAARYRTPIYTQTRVNAIHGHTNVEEVELLEIEGGTTRRVQCDTVVFTADWIPDHELASMAGLTLDDGSRGPRVDTALRTEREGIFAAGNLVHAAEPADVAALGGRRAAASVVQWLCDQAWPRRGVPISCEAPLQWMAPNAVSGAGDIPPRGRFALRCAAFVRRPKIEIRQEGRLLWTGGTKRLVPGRSAVIPWEWIRSVDPGGEAVAVRLVRR